MRSQQQNGFNIFFFLKQINQFIKLIIKYVLMNIILNTCSIYHGTRYFFFGHDISGFPCLEEDTYTKWTYNYCYIYFIWYTLNLWFSGWRPGLLQVFSGKQGYGAWVSLYWWQWEEWGSRCYRSRGGNVDSSSH